MSQGQTGQASIEDRIAHDFAYHPPSSPAIVRAHETVRSILAEAAHALVELTPQCREQSLALTKIEEAMFWSNAAIARNQ